jgi:eukaryotic-like serine/threonine-protein kinase
MKCLEKDRTRRYETANGLAQDIVRHLNNEPISARPPSAVYRFRKTVSRNKLAFSAAAAVVLAILAGLGLATAGFIRANTERQRAEAALADAQEQRALADDNFREARAAVEDLLRISDERLKDQPGLQPLRVELMKAVIDRYEPFLAKPIPDPTPREELARLYARYGQLLLERTEIYDDSVAAEFEKARTLQEQLLKEHPGDRSLRSDLGWTCILEEWRNHTMPPSPERAGRQAVEIFRSLVAEDPSDPFTRDDLVWALWRLSVNAAPDEGIALANEAVAIGEQLVAKYPDSAEFRRELANALRMQAFFLFNYNPTPQSVAKAISIRRRLLDLEQGIFADLTSNRPEAMQPERPKGDEGRMFGDSRMWAEFDVADNSRDTAGYYRKQGDWPHVAEMDDQAATYYKDLADHNPSVATFTGELEHVFKERVNAAEHENDRRLVAALSKEAVAFWRRQIELHPDVPDLKAYADDAAKNDAEVAQWLAQPPSTQP